MKFIRTLLALVVVLLVGTTARAQQFDPNWPYLSGQQQFTLWDVQATTSTLNAATSDLIVDNFSVQSTAGNATIAQQPSGTRSVAIQLYEASGTSLKGTVTVKGTTPFGGTSISQTFNFTGGTQYVSSTLPYMTITQISYNLTGVSVGNDKLRVGNYAVFVPARTNSLAQVRVNGVIETTGTWNAVYSTWLPPDGIADNAVLNFEWGGTLNTSPTLQPPTPQSVIKAKTAGSTL